MDTSWAEQLAQDSWSRFDDAVEEDERTVPSAVAFSVEEQAQDQRVEEETTPSESTNFTWEHFFMHKCGMLRQDALRYESSLIAHRMNPEDTLAESLSLLVSVGQIAAGDELKLVKTVERQKKAIENAEQMAREAREKLGLGKYNALEAKIILKLAGGTDEMSIDWGIEQWEDGKAEMARPAAVGHVAYGFDYVGIKAQMDKAFDPGVVLLRSFGYKTFDYTKEKEVGSVASLRYADDVVDLSSGPLSLDHARNDET